MSRRLNFQYVLRLRSVRNAQKQDFRAGAFAHSAQETPRHWHSSGLVGDALAVPKRAGDQAKVNSKDLRRPRLHTHTLLPSHCDRHDPRGMTMTSGAPERSLREGCCAAVLLQRRSPRSCNNPSSIQNLPQRPALSCDSPQRKQHTARDESGAAFTRCACDGRQHTRLGVKRDACVLTSETR